MRGPNRTRYRRCPLKKLLADYIAAKKVVGKAKGTEKRWKPVFDDLVKFIGHNDARRLTKQNLMEWRDARLKTLSPKTVSDVYLAAIRTVFNWAKMNDTLHVNVAQDVRQEVPKKMRSREKGFTTPEAIAVLIAARDYVCGLSDCRSSRGRAPAARRIDPRSGLGASLRQSPTVRREDATRGQTNVITTTAPMTMRTSPAINIGKRVPLLASAPLAWFPEISTCFDRRVAIENSVAVES
jgi:hypothetical protein